MIPHVDQNTITYDSQSPNFDYPCSTRGSHHQAGRRKDSPLAPIHIILLTQLLHSNFQPIPCKHDVFLLHFRASILADFLDDVVRNVPDNGENDDGDEEDDERNK